MTACRESTEMILNEQSEIMARWRQYFQKLVRDLSIISTEITQESGEEAEKNIERIEEERKGNELPTIYDVRKATQRL
jgi:hypothetical protein